MRPLLRGKEPVRVLEVLEGLEGFSAINVV